MALPPDDAATRSQQLIRDAEEALARERLNLFWHQWGGTIIGMCLMLVVGTGAGVAWREWRESRNEASTMRLVNIVGTDGVPMSADASANMHDNHAAIAWLAKAATVKDAATPEGRAQLADYYGHAVEAGDNTSWGLLARWNLLRLRMDDDTQDAKKLLSDLEDLARDMGGNSLAALPYTDAAVVAGERLKDPRAALKYLEKADKAVKAAGPMAVTIGDLRHLYEIRARINETAAKAQDVKTTPETAR